MMPAVLSPPLNARLCAPLPAGMWCLVAPAAARLCTGWHSLTPLASCHTSSPSQTLSSEGGVALLAATYVCGGGLTLHVSVCKSRRSSVAATGPTSLGACRDSQHACPPCARGSSSVAYCVCHCCVPLLIVPSHCTAGTCTITSRSWAHWVTHPLMPLASSRAQSSRCGGTA